MEIIEIDSDDSSSYYNSFSPNKNSANIITQKNYNTVAKENQDDVLFETESNDAASVTSETISNPGGINQETIDRIKEEATQICRLLSSYDYDHVFHILHKNRWAVNRIELSLWDLLPYKRPAANHRKCITKGNVNRHNNDNSSTSTDQAKSFVENKVSNRTNSELNNAARKGNETLKQNFTRVNQSMLNNGNSFKAQILQNYMKYLSYMHDIKENKLSGKHQHFNFFMKNSTRHDFLKINTTSSLKENNQLQKTVPQKTVPQKTVPQSSITTSFDDYIDSADDVWDSEDLEALQIVYDKHTSQGNVEKPQLPKALEVSTASSFHDYINQLADEQSQNSCFDFSEDSSIKDDVEMQIAMASSMEYSSDNPIINKHQTLALQSGQIVAGTKKKVNPPRKENLMRSRPQTIQKMVPRQISDEARQEHEVQKLCAELKVAFPEKSDNQLANYVITHMESKKGLSFVDRLDELIMNIGQEELQEAKSEILKEKSDMCTYLSGIFPNADTQYLEEVVEKSRDNPNSLMEWTETQLKQPSYETRQQKVEKIKITLQQMQYTSKFDVKQFLKEFPNPVAHFENPNRKCTADPDAIEFLKHHYKKFQVTTITAVYYQCHNHLTLTAQQLEKMVPDQQTQHTSTWENNLTKNIPLLQECTYIKYRKEIIEYMNKLKTEEVREFKKLKAWNELWQCQNCFDEECMPSKCSMCDDGHVFCNSCIVKGTEVSMGDGKTRISCFNCTSEFSLPTLQKILPPMQFIVLIRKRQEAEVMAANVEGLVSCPFCHFASIPPPEDKVFKCLNPECMKESCRNCKELNHLPHRCYEERCDKARLIVEEKMTEGLVRKCVKCSRPYFKEDGCNKITCNCGTLMCYICNKDITSVGYNHFSDTLRDGTCPLHSDNTSINTATVQAIAEKVVTQIKEKDPNVTIDIDGLLRNLPRASNSGAITNRVEQIAKLDT